MKEHKKKSGFTRMEFVLAGLLLVSLGFAAWAVLSVRGGLGPDSHMDGSLSAEEAGSHSFMLEVGAVIQPADFDGKIPSLKGKTNMPAPKAASSPEKKKPPQEAGKQQGAKKVDAQAPAAGAAAQKTPAAVQKPLANNKAGAPTAAGRQVSKIPGIKAELIDVPPAVMELLQELEGMEWSMEVETKLLGAVRRWAKLDIEAASDFALCIERRGTRSAALSSVLNTWLEESPREAVAWFSRSAEKDAFLVGDLTSQFYTRLAARAPLEAMESLWGLPSEGMKRSALQSVSQRLVAIGHGQELLELYDVVETAEDRNIVIDAVMQRMARYEPNQLGSWVFSLQEPDQQERALNAFVSAWSRDYPSAAAEWVVAEVAEGEARSRQIATVVGSWVQEDPIEAAEWLLGLFPASAETDAGVDRFARAVLPENPAYAAEWSFSVTDNNTRWKLMEQIAVKWKTVSPEAARQYIDRTDLPAGTKARLLK